MKSWRFANGMPEGKLLATLRSLRESQVEFILVGGLAAVLNGAPIQTYDVDLVYSREPANIGALAYGAGVNGRYQEADLLAILARDSQIR